VTFLSAEERYIRTVIGKIENEYGGIVPYLAHCGIEAQKITALRALLVEG